MAPPSGVKLRDSCQSCANSKVKCSKDKPTCARCAERGTTCQYLVTQRTGRKFGVRSNSHSASNGRIAPLATAPSSPRQDALPSEASFLDLPFTAFDPSLDDFILASLPPTPPFSLPVTSSSHENTSRGQLDKSSIFPECTSNNENQAANAGFCQSGENFLSEFSSEMETDSLVYEPADFSHARSSFPTTPQLSQLSDITTQSLSCRFLQPESDSLKTALRLMWQLSSRRESPLQNSSLNLTTTTGHGHGNEHERQESPLLPPLQAVIDKNREVIEAIGEMLQLPCSQDGYFLIVVSLIVSLVLSGYANIARGGSSSTLKNDTMQSSSTSSTSTSSHRSSASSSTDRIPSGAALKREEIDPKTTQRVLNELYQVQGLIDMIGAKMQQCAKRNRAFGGEAYSLDNNNDATSLTTFPFSATVLNQLDAELRKRLSTLSLELIDELRQYWG
jgi:hypothetical protein